ncbi:MAG: Gx transporter family protein [Angelakisella sp.]|nr:Gx transporter family protein [Angelakisella sp.]
MGMLFAMAMALSFAESLLPVLPMLPPGFKLGLSNIVTMYTLFMLGTKRGFAIAVMKSLFVLLTRAPVAAFMSLCGGLLSVVCMALCARVRWLRGDYMLLSVIGALAHNLGQLLASVAYTSTVMLYYLPVLVVSGIVMGIVTGTVLRVAMPYINRLGLG